MSQLVTKREKSDVSDAVCSLMLTFMCAWWQKGVQMEHSDETTH